MGASVIDLYIEQDSDFEFDFRILDSEGIPEDFSSVSLVGKVEKDGSTYDMVFDVTDEDNDGTVLATLPYAITVQIPEGKGSFTISKFDTVNDKKETLFNGRVYINRKVI